ncbi:MAG: HTTM domain-containing protein [Bacteroidota bacterium]
MHRLFQSTNIASLVFFRIVFGILAFADILAAFVYKHLYVGAFSPEGFQFRYYGFEWVQPFPEPFMSLFFLVGLAAAVGITIGWRYRLCCTIYALAFSYTFLMEKGFYLNHGYLFCVLSFMMIFLPVHHHLSVDVVQGRVPASKQVPVWPLFLLRFSMGVVYFFGGIAKINADWLNGMPLKLWLKAKADMPVLGWLWGQEWVAYFMSYGGLLLDLFVTFFLLSKRTRLWALFFVLFFHSTNLIIFKIGIFPFLSVALTLLFFEPDFPLRTIAWLEKRLPFIGKIKDWWASKEPTTVLDTLPSPSRNRQILIGTAIGVYCLIHCLLPLRHHYFKGDVAWTEEGHRYAWRMMLRSKRGYGSFRLEDRKTGATFIENPGDYLRPRQKRKLYTHPDMILQFAHFLRDKYKAEKQMDVIVKADIKVRLNGGPYQRYISDSTDLAHVEWSFLEEADWIVPEKKKGRGEK